MSSAVLTIVNLRLELKTKSSSTQLAPLTFTVTRTRPVAVLSDNDAARSSRPDQYASCVLRGIARLDVHPLLNSARMQLDLGSYILRDENATDWRAAVVYVRLNGVLPPVANEHVTIEETVVEVSKYRAQKKRGRTRVAALEALRAALSALGLQGDLAERHWSRLESNVELPCALIALALSTAPRTLLLDGMPSADAAHRIENACRNSGMPLIWACDENTARRLDAETIRVHSKEDPTTAVGLKPTRRHRSSFFPSEDDDGYANGALVTKVKSQLLNTRDLGSTILLCLAIASSCAVTPVRGAVLEFARASRDAVVETVQSMNLKGPAPVSAGQLVVCSLLVFLVAGTSWWNEIGLETKFLTAAVRCAIQLSLLGVILVPIFENNLWWQVIGYMLMMMLVAAQDCASRPPYIFRSKIPMYFWILASFGSTTIFLISFVLFVVLRVGLRALEAIPIGGMVMQSCLSSTAVALSNSLSTLAERKETLEVFLALGATRFEASRALIRQSVVLGMTPIISLMATTGIVSMSGMVFMSLAHSQPPGCSYHC
jgi:putative ABC transport system permease protein